MVHGELEIGTEARPHTRNATITLTNDVPGEDIETMGDRGIMLMGGTLNLHGNRKTSGPSSQKQPPRVAPQSKS
jgi:G8 domain